MKKLGNGSYKVESMLREEKLTSTSLEQSIRRIPIFQRELIEVHSLDEVEKIAEVEDVILITFKRSADGRDEYNSKITNNFLSNVCVKNNSYVQFVKMVVDCCPG